MATADSPRILVAGGDQDPNLHALYATLSAQGQDVFFLQVGKDHHPWIRWQLEDDRLFVEGREMSPRAVFLRHDVFTHLEDERPASAHRAFAWYTAVASWVAGHPRVRCFNRDIRYEVTHKPHVLLLAREAGLDIPDTWVSNHLEGFGDFLPDRSKIVKPINGGGHCRHLDDMAESAECHDGVASAPAIVQGELVPPERRVYRIADTYLGFTVISPELDYRTSRDCRLERWAEIPADLVTGLGKLMDRLGLDFGAADFKTCPETGRLLFLEVNSGPMFAAFDRVTKTAVTTAMASFLTG